MNKIICTLLSFAIGICLHAQNDITVHGLVRDNSGQPVPGAVVMLEGSTVYAAISDLDGKYSLTFRGTAKSVLTATCIGFKNVSETVGTRSEVNFVMEVDSDELEEVVVVGYGAVRRSDLTGSVTSVKIDEDDAGRSSTFDQLIQGKAAGVTVTSNSSAPDAGVSIQIRGVSSLNGSNQPLIVVDGVILTNDADSGSALVKEDVNEENNALAGINPQDIANIEILKDASATAIYGSEGANGVILITTKSASREKPTIHVNIGTDLITNMRRIEVLSFDEYVNMLEDIGDSYSEKFLKRIYENPAAHEGLKVTPMDWQDFAIANKVRQRYYFSIGGKPENMKYTFSLGYNENPGLIRTTGSRQYTIRAGLDRTFFDKLTVGVNVNFAYIHTDAQQGAAVGTNSSSLVRTLVLTRPFVDGLIDEDGEEDETVSYASVGPNRWFNHAYIRRDKYRATPSAYAQYKISRSLSFKSSFGMDYNVNEQKKWKGREVSRSNGSQAGISEGVSRKWNFDNTLQFNEKYLRHTLYGTAGMTMGQQLSTNQSVSATNIIQDALMSDNINSATTASIAYSEIHKSNLSLFARVVYSYADRYVLTSTYRLDGSSMFRGKNRFSSFPSMAFAWRASQEPWFGIPKVSMLKFRLGWGLVGNSNAGAYATYNVYNPVAVGNHFSESGYIRGVVPGQFSNPDLKWETTRQYNVGIDLGLFAGRVSLSADAYDKTTFDLLQNKMVPYASGFETRWVNQGTINNKGLEFTLNVVPVKTKSFEWAFDGNLSFNRNKLVSLGFDMGEKDIYFGQGEEPRHFSCYEGASVSSNVYVTQAANIFIEGMPIGLFYGYKTDGIVPEGGEGVPISSSSGPQGPGQINYVDMNGNGYIDEDDRTIIGRCSPDFTYGFGTSLSWKTLTLSVNFQGVYGNQIFNANRAQEYDVAYDQRSNVRREAYYNAWTPENQNTSVFKLVKGWATGGSNVERGYVSDRYVEDGSYLRLSSVAMSWRLPIRKNQYVRDISLGASVNNVYVWTRYSGWDPDVNSFGNSMTRMGIDAGSYPPARTFCFDLKFTF